ncbi:DUF3574 domain-containing protein [Maricurvus nonylphenolicus]|uniref:DUF3574 domain-containing protein n=1 Tax=Maricurvus nonylphenolicus TaxID=1008307 RepID=UPI0036F41952
MKKSIHYLLVSMLVLVGSSASYAEEVFRLRMFFGLSLPGGGAVSLAEWQSFQQEEIVKVFDGFNVVDSVGYYKGKPERSKIVTVIVESKDIAKANALASLYAKRFKQDSVMIVKVPVLEWSFIGPDGQN